MNANRFDALSHMVASERTRRGVERALIGSPRVAVRAAIAASLLRADSWLMPNAAPDVCLR